MFTSFSARSDGKNAVCKIPVRKEAVSRKDLRSTALSWHHSVRTKRVYVRKKAVSYRNRSYGFLPGGKWWLKINPSVKNSRISWMEVPFSVNQRVTDMGMNGKPDIRRSSCHNVFFFSWKFVLSFEASFRKWKGFIAFSLFLWEKYRIKAYSKIQKFIGFRMVYRIKYILPAVGRTDPKHSFASPDKSWILTKAELRLSALRRQLCSSSLDPPVFLR